MSKNAAVSFHQLTAFIITLFATLLPLKYQNPTPFAALPTTMFVAVSSMILYYLLCVGQLRIPMTRFSAVAHHLLLVLSAYVAVSTLAAALLPDRLTPFLYTIFGLLSAGQVLYVFRDKLAIIQVEDEEGEASKFEAYGRRARRFLKSICFSVTKFFGEHPQPVLPI